MAEIFYRLSSSFKSMGVGGFPDNFINDSALLSLAGHLADAFRQTGHFPQVLIVDDIVIHGQSLSAFLEEIEELLFSLLPEYSRETIIVAWLRVVDIRAFARNNQPLLLTSRYQPNFTVEEIMAPKRWRDLSNRISRLIQLSGRVNSSFVSGADLESAGGQVDWDSLQVKGFTRVDTEYDFFPQTLFYRPVVISSGVYAIYSVRLFTSAETGGMVAAPFVFLPDLPVENTEEMIHLALSQLRTRLVSTALEPGGCWKKCPRTRLEALTLLLSSSLLNEVCALAGFTPTYNGQIKLAMNYGAGQVDASKYFVSGVLSPAPLLSLEQMDAPIASCAALPECSLMNIPMSEQWLSPASGDTALMEYMENTAYAISLKNYTWLYAQTQICQAESPEDIDTPDSFVLLRKLLRQLERGVTYSPPLPQLIAWMFQLLDSGILAVAVRTVLRNGVYCAAQCAKTGEQSQFILPKRYQQFIPVLIFIQKIVYTRP